MFYDRFDYLCKQKGVKPGKACSDMGLSRSLAAKWKNTKTEKPSIEVLEACSVYFGMSIDEILGIKKTAQPEGQTVANKVDEVVNLLNQMNTEELSMVLEAIAKMMK